MKVENQTLELECPSKVVDVEENGDIQDNVLQRMEPASTGYNGSTRKERYVKFEYLKMDIPNSGSS